MDDTIAHPQPAPGRARTLGASLQRVPPVKWLSAIDRHHLKLALCLMLVYLGYMGIVQVAFAQHPGQIVGVASIIDGDTLEIHGQRIRLHGIDAPESSQTCRRADGQRWRCGAAAANALADHITGRTTYCRVITRDPYGRVVARCDAGHGDLGAWLVGQGWALAYARFSRDYLPLEAEARRLAVGIHAGEFQDPRHYRREHPRESGRRASP